MLKPGAEQALPDLSDHSRADWGPALKALVEARGEYIELDANHHVMQVGSGDKLLVTFESAHDIRNRQDDALPHGLKLAEAFDISVLVVMCLTPTWFRSEPVFEFFDAMTDDETFDLFEHVVFYGVGMGGYAAAAFSVAAPGCDVVAVSPQATLDPTMTEWDPRFPSARRFSWTDRYAFAPEMADAARHAMVLYNPSEDLEAMHAALYARGSITRFACRYVGRDLAAALEDMRVLDAALGLALDKKLSQVSFAGLYRRRRDYGPFLRTLLTEVEDLDRPKLVTWLAESVLTRKNMPRMRRALERVRKAGDTSAAAE